MNKSDDRLDHRVNLAIFDLYFPSHHILPRMMKRTGKTDLLERELYAIFWFRPPLAAVLRNGALPAEASNQYVT